MKVRVRLFASLAERAGWRENELELPDGSDVAAVLALLRSDALDGLPEAAPVLCARNHEHCEPEEPLADGDELAFFPPVSGGDVGSDDPSEPDEPPPERVLLTEDVLDPVALTNWVRGPGHGAILTFEGTVRNHSKGDAVTAIDYQAYPEMAVPEMTRIRVEVEERWPGTRLAIAHRIGRLEVGETSVIVACGAAHRWEAFQACRLAMDRVKESVPLWKHEDTADSGVRWV
ncbi:MAG: molybdenum cofactor biosynthesis protein MoaE [Acidobacteriota bacterium]